METHAQRNDRLQDDNKELSAKLHTMLEQYEKREEVWLLILVSVYICSFLWEVIWSLLMLLQHYQTLMKKRDLETQLYEAKLGQLQMIIEKEQEKYAEEKKMVVTVKNIYIVHHVTNVTNGYPVSTVAVRKVDS